MDRISYFLRRTDDICAQQQQRIERETIGKFSQIVPCIQ